jgi:hypothetical protein
MVIAFDSIDSNILCVNQKTRQVEKAQSMLAKPHAIVPLGPHINALLLIPKQNSPKDIRIFMRQSRDFLGAEQSPSLYRILQPLSKISCVSFYTNDSEPLIAFASSSSSVLIVTLKDAEMA